MSKHRHLPRTAGIKVDEDGNVFERRLQRQVLIPGRRKAAPHPWAARLRAAMDGQPTTKAMAKVREQQP